MREEFKLWGQSCRESQDQSRLDKEKLDQQLEQVTQQLNAHKQGDQQLLRQKFEQEVGNLQQQFNEQSKQQKKLTDRMGKQIEKVSQWCNQQPKQNNERSKLVEGAVVIDQVKNSMYYIPVCGQDTVNFIIINQHDQFEEKV